LHGLEIFKNTFRLSPTRDTYEYPNPKWVAEEPKSVSNRKPILKTYFGLPERHNPNISVLSPRNLFAKRILL
jgi:hypothetical protein